MQVHITPAGLFVSNNGNRTLTLPFPKDEHVSVGLVVNESTLTVNLVGLGYDTELVAPVSTELKQVIKTVSPYVNGKLPREEFEKGYLDVIGDGGNFRSLMRKFRKSSEGALRMQVREYRSREAKAGRTITELKPMKRGKRKPKPAVS